MIGAAVLIIKVRYNEIGALGMVFLYRFLKFKKKLYNRFQFNDCCTMPGTGDVSASGIISLVT